MYMPWRRVCRVRLQDHPVVMSVDCSPWLPTATVTACGNVSSAYRVKLQAAVSKHVAHRCRIMRSQPCCRSSRLFVQAVLCRRPAPQDMPEANRFSRPSLGRDLTGRSRDLSLLTSTNAIILSALSERACESGHPAHIGA